MLALWVRLEDSVEDDSGKTDYELEQESCFLHIRRLHSDLVAERPAAEEGFLCIMFRFSRNDLLPNSVLQNVTAFHALQSIAHTFWLTSWML